MTPYIPAGLEFRVFGFFLKYAQSFKTLCIKKEGIVGDIMTRAFREKIKGLLPEKSGKLLSPIVALFLLILLPPFLSGCIGGSRSTLRVEQYVLDYPSPVPKGLSPLNELIKVERFSVVQAFNSSAMVYEPAPFQHGVYYYHRWRVNPGDMVTDYLLRDLRKTGLFRAVFSYNDSEAVRFRLEGSVEEFLELDNKESGKAVLSVNVTLLDLLPKEVSERVVFQKNYRYEEPMKEQTARGLAQGMSMAMETLSDKLMVDLYNAIKNRKLVLWRSQ